MALNADGSDYIEINYEKYDLIELFGKPALFTGERLSQANIPAGLHVCHVRGDDETTGGFAELAPRVLVNHFGSIVTKEPIDFGKEGYIPFTEDTERIFTGNSITMRDFIDGSFSMERYRIKRRHFAVITIRKILKVVLRISEEYTKRPFSVCTQSALQGKRGA